MTSTAEIRPPPDTKGAAAWQEPDEPIAYFHAFDDRVPHAFPPISARAEQLWQLFAGLSVGFGAWYLIWRWTSSLNPDAMWFSVIVALAETLVFAGTLLFIHDIWREGDTPMSLPPATRAEANLGGQGPIRVDVYITTFDEGVGIVAPTIRAAKALRAPPGVVLSIHVLDDGGRAVIADAARKAGVGYITRPDNEGFKAGNLRNALMRTTGDFVVICDADTRVMPGFLDATLGYFRDPKVAWVQTPHWFCDLPDGLHWDEWLGASSERRSSGGRAPWAWLRRVSGGRRIGHDPFLTDGSFFFDIIQRRRNRNHASFCCGAGSIHRREALYSGALVQARRETELAKRRADPGLVRRVLRTVFGTAHKPSGVHGAIAGLQPFRFHVSEDILTSIALHSDRNLGWRSVYHPQVECRMLSPLSVEAWSIQRLKYAGGTFDIMLRLNPLFRRGMPLRTKLHYAATFWSYLSVIWVPVLVMAPVMALMFGVSPVDASALEFFSHLLPALILNEIALAITSKGHSLHKGRVLALTLLPIQARALWLVIRGERPRFPTTPKALGSRRIPVDRILANIVALIVMTAAALIGLWSVATDRASHDLSLVITNLLWLGWNAWGIGQILIAALWQRSQRVEDTMTEAGMPVGNSTWTETTGQTNDQHSTHAA